MSNNLSPVLLESDINEGVHFTIEVDPQIDQASLKYLHERHWTMLIVSILVLSLSFFLGLRGSGSSASIEAWGFELPSLCVSRSWFGLECPGCGLTRSFVALASGDLAESIRYHRVGWVLFFSVALQIPYRIFSLRELRIRIVQRSWPEWFGAFLITVLLGNWLLKTTL